VTIHFISNSIYLLHNFSALLNRSLVINLRHHDMFFSCSSQLEMVEPRNPFPSTIGLDVCICWQVMLTKIGKEVADRVIGVIPSIPPEVFLAFSVVDFHNPDPIRIPGFEVPNYIITIT
jgi:hypothetical protein